MHTEKQNTEENLIYIVNPEPILNVSDLCGRVNIVKKTQIEVFKPHTIYKNKDDFVMRLLAYIHCVIFHTFVSFLSNEKKFYNKNDNGRIFSNQKLSQRKHRLRKIAE